ncbi:hypothetical protein QE152_g40650 [Popillia japonica]|uniref:Uncharacterized protein n=1 Tax=Popillia japonica TaxID=7064 RepID=A0AAW1HFL7_POPJA
MTQPPNEPFHIPNLREICVVDCTGLNIDRTLCVFSAMCPSNMQVVSAEEIKTIKTKRCRWLVKYKFKEDSGLLTNEENAKYGFKCILKMIPENCEVVDRNISGRPFCNTYNVLYGVTNCNCYKLEYQNNCFSKTEAS